MSLKEDWGRLVHGRPGRRFLDFHQARCKRRAGAWPLERVLTLVIGTLLLLGGLAIGWLPGPGGFIGIFGAALLGVEWLPMARLLDRSERLLWSVLGFIQRRLVGRKQALEE